MLQHTSTQALIQLFISSTNLLNSIWAHASECLPNGITRVAVTYSHGFRGRKGSLAKQKKSIPSPFSEAEQSQGSRLFPVPHFRFLPKFKNCRAPVGRMPPCVWSLKTQEWHFGIGDQAANCSLDLQLARSSLPTGFLSANTCPPLNLGLAGGRAEPGTCCDS